MHISIVIASVLIYLVCFITHVLSPQYELCEASRKGHTAVVRILLENKADPNITNNVSYSIIPFHQ